MSKKKRISQQLQNIDYFDHREKERLAKKKVPIEATFAFCSQLQPGLVTTVLLASILIASVAAETQHLDRKTTDQQKPNQSTSKPTSTEKAVDSPQHNGTASVKFVGSSDSYDFSSTNGSSSKMMTTPQQNARPGKVSTKEIRKLISSKLVYDSSIVKKEQKQNCDLIKGKIISTIKRLPASKAHIIRPLQANGFKLVCTSPDKLLNMTGHSRHKMAFDSSDNGIMYYTTNTREFDRIAISHEFMHADTFFLHRSKKCFSLEYPTQPVWPMTRENIDIYNEALNQGDAHVREFSKLREKQKNHLQLSHHEKLKLNQYIKASKNCLNARFMGNVTEGLFRVFRRNRYELNMEGPQTAYHPDYKEDMLIHDVFFNTEKNRYQADMEIIDPAHIIIETVEEMRNVFEEHDLYHSKSIARLTDEREAFTFAHLSEEGRDAFYPEANELRKTYIKRCI